MMEPKGFKSGLACLAILVVVIAWFSPWWAAGKVLAPLDLQNLMMSPWRAENETGFAKNHIVADGVDQYLVYRMVAAKSYAKEGWLGWSSLTYGGTAEHANTMALYYDWTMQLHRWFDFWKAWHLGLMGQVLLAAFGMFLFLRGRAIGRTWACCGALVYAANSQFVTWIFHRWALSSFCWVPWILWAIDGYRKGRRGFWAAVPLFIAMAFLGGTLQHGALVVLAVTAMWLEEALQQRAACKINHPKSINATQRRLLGRYTAWGLLAAGLAGMMLLPCIDAFLTSNRLGLHTGMTANAANSIYPQGPLQPLYNLAAYPLQIFPSILGRCGSADVLKLFKSELFYVAYFGSLPVLLAFLVFWRREAPLVARLLTGMGLLLPLTPLVRFLYQRLFLLFIIGGILAFAHFMQTASSEAKLKLLRIVGIVAALCTASWTTISLLLLLQPSVIGMIRRKIESSGSGSSFGYFTEWIALRADRFTGDLFIWSPQQLFPLVLFACVLAGLWLSCSLIQTRRLSGIMLMALALVAEVTLFGARWMVWSDPVKTPLFAATPESEALRKAVGREGRVTTLPHPTGHMAMTPFIPNTLSAYGIATISGYDSIVPDGMILPGESPGDAEQLGRIGVSHLITWAGNPGVPGEWKAVWNSPSMDLYENTRCIPRRIGFHDDAGMNAFFAGGLPAHETIDESLHLENRRMLNVPAGIRWIRIAENQAAGWEYRTKGNPDSEWQPVRRAPDASMLIPNPHPGETTHIEMRYNPPLKRMGLAVSGISLALVIAGGFVRPRQHIHKP